MCQIVDCAKSVEYERLYVDRCTFDAFVRWQVFLVRGDFRKNTMHAPSDSQYPSTEAMLCMFLSEVISVLAIGVMLSLLLRSLADMRPSAKTCNASSEKKVIETILVCLSPEVALRQY